MRDMILTLNAGSSSVKFAAYTSDGDRALYGQIKGLGTFPHLVIHDQEIDDRPVVAPNITTATQLILKAVAEHLPDATISAVGHRVVHGGHLFDHATIITPEALEQIDSLSHLAPEHQPVAVEAIRIAQQTLPDALHTASFDTSFHLTTPPVARSFALPPDILAHGVERYGFHGLSYEYLASQFDVHLPATARKRVVAAHLGNGSSLCAILDGKSVETTMGFTALDGLPMGSRCGSIDPGLVLHLIRHEGYSAEDLERAFYKRSGLYGLSGESNDVAVLLESSSPKAAFALEFYAYQVALNIGRMVTALGGLDTLIFAGGIGEHAAPVRAAIADHLAYLGIAIEATANDENALNISAPTAEALTFVIPTDEEAILRRDALRLLTT